MQSHAPYDIVIAGGGLAGSLLAGVMARAGFGVLIVEREERFRDRVRGESVFPWGVAEIEQLNIRHIFHQAGAVYIIGLRSISDQVAADTYRWSDHSIDGLPMLGFSHPAVQRVALEWASGQGAALLRPARVLDVTSGDQPEVTIDTGRDIVRHRARLVIGSGGGSAKIRRWTGGTSAADPPNHRFGGVLASGIKWDDNAVEMSTDIDHVAYWFPVSSFHTRLFLGAQVSAPTASGAGGFSRFIETIERFAPADRLKHARQEGPLAFFPNQCTWATRISGRNVALLGDAAGSLDPTQGHGTSLLLRDVRLLSNLLLQHRDWQRAIDAYAVQHVQTFSVLREFDRWMTMLRPTNHPRAESLREGHHRAVEADPSLGGWRMLSARGPDALVADETARRHFFGEDLT